ncbi:hypothetical protein C1H46_032683 [Malus baccata]|uniref:Peptidase M3A/M3B catalytic domain-containing protein n=1 Tax=Malus baccata TaxID=106549 RepID=A0A540L5Y1_MALBA|nr:hypothetical protein C1H46_032683 [Malus baccata]
MRLDMLFIRCFQERYYSLDYRVLRRFAKHNSTGEIIPEELVMQGARKMFAATDLQRQINVLFLLAHAGYYSYLYAKCFAATIWLKLCEEDPLSLATGSALRLKLLQYGGAKEAADLLNGLVGGGGGGDGGIFVRNCDGGGKKVVCGVASDRQPRPLSCHLRAEGANLLSTQVARARRTKLPSSMTEF